MSAEDKIMTLKFENRSGMLLHTNDWLAGVYYEDENENKNKNINENERMQMKTTSKKMKE